MDMSTTSENLENEDCGEFWKVKVNSCEFPMKQNNSTELLGHPFIKIQSKIGLPDPGRPKIGYFSISLIEPLQSPY